MKTTKARSSSVLAVTGTCLVLLTLASMPKIASGGPETTPSRRGGYVEQVALKRVQFSWFQLVRFAAMQSVRMAVRIY